MCCFKKYFRVFIAVTFVISVSSCMTYYQINESFNSAFIDGKMEEANLILDKDKKAEKRKTKFIHYMNKGITEQLLGHHELSNEYFEKAYIFGEDYQKNYLNIAASFLTNPNMIVYKGESFEHLLVNYYKSLNYLFLENYDAALVEAKRMEIRLHFYNDKVIVKKDSTKYNKDAFIQNLMGIIYQADRDYNNAYIAYRNAFKIYKKFNTKYLGMIVPEQLKTDMMYCAYKSGFHDDIDFYNRKWETKYEYVARGKETVFLWHNGLVPVKDEWSINFFVFEGAGGYVNFKNEDLGIDFPFYVGDREKKASTLGDIKTLRVAFPKYVNRDPFYHSAYLEIEGQQYNFSYGQNMDGIARKSLKDRMMKELGSSLIRLATKKATEARIRKENEALGALAGIANAITEKADTRHCQTLPNQIHYTRVPRLDSAQQVRLHCQGNGSNSRTFELTIPPNAPFYLFHTMDSKQRIW